MKNLFYLFFSIFIFFLSNNSFAQYTLKNGNYYIKVISFSHKEGSSCLRIRHVGSLPSKYIQTSNSNLQQINSSVSINQQNLQGGNWEFVNGVWQICDNCPCNYTPEKIIESDEYSKNYSFTINNPDNKDEGELTVSDNATDITIRIKWYKIKNDKPTTVK
ncbi:hypothetical protein [Flammeovirga sp. SJP92]|uniref:hypothetical protein n=1 Tax=Flammeovirga sp. SJP92 TaxID=1775430 RepID=UPI000788A940|nr:hypothetical protein [Flammeovirga sp. SJP92]KXX67928.1 hypothetical protein AVL50_24025 [Flammeovirga sp. SJP92]